MKFTKFLSTTLLTYLCSISFSQDIIDPVKATGNVPAPSGIDGRSQDVIAAEWLNKAYITRYRYSSNSTMMQMGSSVEFEFLKSESGLVNKINVTAFDIYPASSSVGSEFVRKFYLNNMKVLYVSPTSIVLYSHDSDEKVTDIEFVAGKKMSYKAAKAEIETYLEYGWAKIEADREAKVKAREEHRKKYSLVGKDVVSIEIIYPKGKPEYMDLNSVEIGFEATLADGTKIKTQNCGGQGYIEDYKLEFHNGARDGISSEYSPGMYGAYAIGKPSMKGAFTDINGKDIFKMTVTAKHSGSGKLEVVLPLKYPTSYKHTANGESGYQYPGNGRANGTAAGHGSPLTIYVKKVKHSETGIDLYLIKIEDGFSGSERFIKIDATGKLSVEAVGGTGGAGSPGKTKLRDETGKPENGGNGGRGGNGGNILLIVDPSAKNFELSYKNSGGYGGDAGRGGDCISCVYGSRGDSGYKGESGNDGSFKKEVRAVNI